MKSPEDIEHRLKKLVDRYKHKYISNAQRKLPSNCLYNRLHVPTGTAKSDSSKLWESSLSPRRQVTLVVLQPERPVGLCTYGSENPETWNGDLCDDESISGPCTKFEPISSKDELTSAFNSLLKDDETVLETYPDIAALQWVLDSRVWEWNLDDSEMEINSLRSKLSESLKRILETEKRLLEVQNRRWSFSSWLKKIFGSSSSRMLPSKTDHDSSQDT